MEAWLEESFYSPGASPADDLAAAYDMRTAQESRWAAAYSELLSYIPAVLLTGSKNEGSPSQPTLLSEKQAAKY